MYQKTSENTSLLVAKDYHLLRGSRIIIANICNRSSAYFTKYFDNLFPNIALPWKKIYLTARKATHLRCFNYRIIDNVLYLNKKLFQFGKNQSPLCSFCHTEIEITVHVFHKCSVTKILWNQLLLFFETDLDLTPQAALLVL